MPGIDSLLRPTVQGVAAEAPADHPVPAHRRQPARAVRGPAGPAIRRQGGRRRRPGLVTTESPHRLVRGTEWTRSR